MTYAKILQKTDDLSAIVTKVCDAATTQSEPTEPTALIKNTIDLALTKQSLRAFDISRRDLNHIVRGIADDANLDDYIALLFNDTLHCPIPTKYTKLGHTNTKFPVSSRLVKITYKSLADKQTVQDNLRLLKDSDHMSLRFSDDYNPDQLAELNAKYKEARALNDANADISIRHCVRGSPSKNLYILKLKVTP